MQTAAPQYTLVSDCPAEESTERWRFVLQGPDGSPILEAGDEEPAARRERLELLAVVRGLEALDQPSRVTVLTASQYVRRGMAYGLEEWRANGWTWEHYGQMVLVKNHDLWQRLDRALSIHQVECRQWRIDPSHARQSAPRSAEANAASRKPRNSSLASRFKQAVGRFRRGAAQPQSWPELAAG